MTNKGDVLEMEFYFKIRVCINIERREGCVIELERRK